MASSTLLFYIGMACPILSSFPLAFGFLTQYGAEEVLVSTDIRSYLDFVVALFITFGGVVQVVSFYSTL